MSADVALGCQVHKPEARCGCVVRELLDRLTAERAGRAAEVEALRRERDARNRAIGTYEDALTAAEATVARVRALHRPDGGSDGPGAICVECTLDFGTGHEEPIPYPCPTVAALDGER